MFWNSDLSFYGNTGGGGASWGGWGQWQPYMAQQQQQQEPAPTPVEGGGGVALPAAMADPYALNPATFQGFLQKNVSELGGYDRLSQLITPEMRQGYQDWMATTEAGTATGAAKYLAQLSQQGVIGDLTSRMWEQRDAASAAAAQQLAQFSQPVQQQQPQAPNFYYRVIKGDYDY